jgi:hypothetical protein
MSGLQIGFGLFKNVLGSSSSEIVFFDTIDPNTIGTIFNPNTPEQTDTLYVSSSDGSIWIWNGVNYEKDTSNEYWESGSSGIFSIRAKNDSGLDATGDYSYSEGYNTIASGNFSHAEGGNNDAIGIYSHAEGFGNVASGDYSHAEGIGTIASGTGSHAEGGEGTTASGDLSHAEGFNTRAIGSSSHAEGYNTTASSLASHAEGKGTLASGDYSHAEGLNTDATNESSHAEGRDTTASGIRSHAEGYLTTASGSLSHAEGSNSTASGLTSHAEGQGTLASGDYSHAEGIGTIASGYGSHSGGVKSSTKGISSRYSIGSDDEVSGAGTSQLSIGSIVGNTTTNVVAEMIAYPSVPIALPLQNNEAIRVKGSILGKQSGSINVASYDFDCLIVRGVSALTTVIRINNVNLVYDDIVLDIVPSLVADTTIGGLSIKSGSKTSTTIKWSARLDSVEVIKE